MNEDLLLLLEPEKEKIYEVLRPHVNLEILEYLSGGFFDNDEKRLVAYAIAKVDVSFYEERGYLFDYFEKGYSSCQSKVTSEKTKKYINETSYQSKSIEECIEEGLYHHLLISFFGDFDYNAWHIIRNYSFTDEQNVHLVFQNLVRRAREPIKDWLFKDSIFQNTEQFFEHLNYPGRRDNIPVSINMRPYIGHSHLVAIVRNERKTIVNSAFEAYIKKAFFEPFTIKLKTWFPQKYYQMSSFWASLCDMMYPDNKQFCLMITFAIDSAQVARLQCFVYIITENIFYEWTYLPTKPYEHYGAYSEAIVDIFKPISKCDHMDYIREPECTLDDDDFWNNYVFKKENDKYLYLKEIKIN